MGMLKWMCVKTRKYRIINEHIWEHLEVALIGDEFKETCLKWFGHVQCRPAMAPMRKSLLMQVDGPPRKRGRGGHVWK